MEPLVGPADASDPLVEEDAVPECFEEKRDDGCDEDRYPVETKLAHPALR
jgi:hypothetical protein